MANTLFDAARLWPRWQSASKDPPTAQQRAWESIRPLLARGTFWPQLWGDDTVPPLHDFAPTDYSLYAKAIEGCFHETTSPLNGEPIIAWVRSSGSSGKARLFPWTPTYRQQYVDGSTLPLPMMEKMARLRGKAGGHLAMTTPTASRHSPAGVPIGYATTFTAANDGSIYPDEACSSVERIRWWRSCYALATPVRSIMTTTCEPIFLMLQHFEEASDHYRAVLEGRKALPDDLPPLPLADERRRYLLDRLGTGPLDLTDIWPELDFIHTWRAGAAGLQAERLQATTSESVRFIDLCYNASEGPIANPIAIDEVGGPSLADSVVHEFLPQGAAGTADEILKAWELEEGGIYEVLLTTAMGVVRYRVGDLVQCTGHFHRMPKLRYHRRVHAELSLGRCVFTEDEVVTLLKHVPPPPEVDLVFGPSDDGRGLVLYTDRPLPAHDITRMQDMLVASNEPYAAKIAGELVQPLRQIVLDDPALWDGLRPAHAQSKRHVLLLEPPRAISKESE